MEYWRYFSIDTYGNIDIFWQHYSFVMKFYYSSMHNTHAERGCGWHPTHLHRVDRMVRKHEGEEEIEWKRGKGNHCAAQEIREWRACYGSAVCLTCLSQRSDLIWPWTAWPESSGPHHTAHQHCWPPRAVRRGQGKYRGCAYLLIHYKGSHVVGF